MVYKLEYIFLKFQLKHNTNSKPVKYSFDETQHFISPFPLTHIHSHLSHKSDFMRFLLMMTTIINRILF
jgi:hypothetical protein